MAADAGAESEPSEPAVHALQLASQQAVLIGKIARKDVPHEWPELIPALAEAIQSSNALAQQRGLLVLYRSMKALSTKRLTGARALFRQTSVEMFQTIRDLWLHTTDSFFTAVAAAASFAESDSLLDALELARLTLKLLRVLLAHGCPDYHSNVAVVEFTEALVMRHKTFIELRDALPGGEDNLLSGSVDKSIVLCNKVYLEAQERQPISFVRVMDPIVELALEQIFSAKQTTRKNRPPLERSVVMFMSLIRGILMDPKYKPPRTVRLEDVETAMDRIAGGLQQLEQPLSALAVEAMQHVISVLSEPTLLELCQVLIGQYFVLTPEDREQWAEAPEECVEEATGEAWKFSLRPCAEHLYTALVKQFGKKLSPIVLELVQGVLATPPADERALLLREAAYTALSGGVGINSVATDLYDAVDFDGLYVGTLLGELQNPAPEYALIKRRVLWLIGQWVPVNFDVQGQRGLRKTLFEAIGHLMDQSQDMVVRLTACSTLKLTVDDFGFNIHDLLPMVDPMFNQLFQLLHDVSQCDSKMRVLDVISLLVQRLGIHVRPHSESLAKYLPTLWQSCDGSDEYNMLRTAIVRSLIELVASLGPTSAPLYGFLCEIIQQSVGLTEAFHVYLLEDGLDLWHTTMQHAVAMADEFLHLFALMIPLFERADRSVRTCLRITESYVLLDGSALLQAYGPVLAGALVQLASSAPKDGVKYICQLCDMIITVFPEAGCVLLGDVVQSQLQSLVDENDTVSPPQPQIGLMSRVMAMNSAFFFPMVAASSERCGADLLVMLVDTMVEKYDTVSEPRTTKLVALAFGKMLAEANFQRCIEARFALVINVIISGLHALHFHGDEYRPVDWMVCVVPAGEESGADEAARRRKLTSVDPVYRVNTREHIQQQLGKLEAGVGSTSFQHLMDTVDPVLVQQLQRFMDT